MDDATALAVTRWLAKAGNDLVTAKTMVATEPPVTDTACFHAQQCVEKCLKAFLVYKNVEVEKTHYLPRLLELCRTLDSQFELFEDTAVELTDYAVSDRYPDNWREIPLDEAVNAVSRAESLMQYVRQRLGFR